MLPGCTATAFPHQAVLLALHPIFNQVLKRTDWGQRDGSVFTQAFAALAWNPASVPGAYMLATSQSSVTLDALFWPLRAMHASGA